MSNEQQENQKLIAVPAELLESILGMAESHVEDIESGIDEGIYDEEDNDGLPDMKHDIEQARALLKGTA